MFTLLIDNGQLTIDNSSQKPIAHRFILCFS